MLYIKLPVLMIKLLMLLMFYVKIYGIPVQEVQYGIEQIFELALYLLGRISEDLIVRESGAVDLNILHWNNHVCPYVCIIMFSLLLCC